MSHFQNGNDYCNEIVELFQKRRRPSDTTDRARNKQCRDEIADRKDKKKEVKMWVILSKVTYILVLFHIRDLKSYNVTYLAIWEYLPYLLHFTRPQYWNNIVAHHSSPSIHICTRMNKIEYIGAHMDHLDMFETFLMRFLTSLVAWDNFEKKQFLTFFLHFHQNAISE